MNIVEFALFGSVLRNDFNSESDVDVLVSLIRNKYFSIWLKCKKLNFLAEKLILLENCNKNPYRRKISLNMEVLYMPEERIFAFMGYA